MATLFQGVIVFLCAACGSTPARPSPPKVPTGYSTVGRLVDVLDSGRAAEGTIVLEGSEAIASEASGFFTVRSGTPGDFRATIGAPGYFDRETGIAVPGPPADISLISESFDMETYNQLARTAVDAEGRKSLRWIVAPRLVIYTRLLDCSTNAPEQITMLSEEIAEADIVAAVSSMRRALGAPSGGAFLDFSQVVRERGEAGERRILRHSAWSDAIHAGGCESLTTWGREVDGGAAIIRFSAPFVVSGGIALWRAGISEARRQRAQMHELGHTLGLGHTFTHVPSIMSLSVTTFDISSFDRQAGRILFARPPGNRTPDIDPSGFVVNGGATSLASVSPIGSLSAPAATWMCLGPPHQ